MTSTPRLSVSSRICRIDVGPPTQTTSTSRGAAQPAGTYFNRRPRCWSWSTTRLRSIRRSSTSRLRGRRWVRISDDVPVDEDRRDEAWSSSRLTTTLARADGLGDRTRTRRRGAGRGRGRPGPRPRGLALPMLEAGRPLPTSPCPIRTRGPHPLRSAWRDNRPLLYLARHPRRHRLRPAACAIAALTTRRPGARDRRLPR